MSTKDFSSTLTAITNNQNDMLELISNWSLLVDSGYSDDVTFTLSDGTVSVIPSAQKVIDTYQSEIDALETTVSALSTSLSSLYLTVGQQTTNINNLQTQQKLVQDSSSGTLYVKLVGENSQLDEDPNPASTDSYSQVIWERIRGNVILLRIPELQMLVQSGYNSTIKMKFSGDLTEFVSTIEPPATLIKTISLTVDGTSGPHLPGLISMRSDTDWPIARFDTSTGDYNYSTWPVDQIRLDETELIYRWQDPS